MSKNRYTHSTFARKGKCQWCGTYTFLIRTSLRFMPNRPSNLNKLNLCLTCRWMWLEQCRLIRLNHKKKKRRNWGAFIKAKKRYA